MFEAVEHPGITGSVKAETRNHKPVIEYYLDDVIYKTEKEVLEAWKNKENWSNGL